MDFLHVGSRLPMIFARGQPAKLQDLSLTQLQKFVPFLVKCVSKLDLEPSCDPELSACPSWWPAEFPFSREILTEQLPQKKRVQRLLKIVYACYSYHNSSYIIAFSSALAAGQQHYGKLTFIDSPDGTSRILNSKKQLIVVIRTSTRYYDVETNGHKNSRRSPRLVDSGLDIAATDFKNCFRAYTRLTRIDDPKVPKVNSHKFGYNMKGVKRKVVDDITNHLTNSPKPQPAFKPKSIFSKKGPSRKKGRSKRIQPIDQACQYCKEVFSEGYLCIEHEDICQRRVAPGEDLRDFPDKMTGFASFLGLVPTSTHRQILEPETRDAEDKKTSVKAIARPLRKVTARSKIGAFIKQHPMPITSLRGQSILAKFGERVKPPLTSSTPLYEKNCRSRRTTVPHYTPDKVITSKKHKFRDQYVHTYSFGKTRKILRNAELVVGMSHKSFKLFNQCKPLTVSLERLSKKVVADIQERDKQRLLAVAKRKQINLSKLVKKCQATVKLRDFKKDPTAIPAKYRRRLESLQCAT